MTTPTTTNDLRPAIDNGKWTKENIEENGKTKSKYVPTVTFGVGFLGLSGPKAPIVLGTKIRKLYCLANSMTLCTPSIFTLWNWVEKSNVKWIGIKFEFQIHDARGNFSARNDNGIFPGDYAKTLQRITSTQDYSSTIYLPFIAYWTNYLTASGTFCSPIALNNAEKWIIQSIRWSTTIFCRPC